eukprot:CAMPEP_0204329462 /NCGR_PEP_ID=MMETSP0469-20131031/14173_1 /ASSEMBLY_ACC=CAM_ASM_000384 /TAXON_ID=2969 /ORGANISM="Oxyrrhis marina" /LENGTH=60 /DNA_ID=CAMNT_0051312057 /DNA_START=39 /DNA_END=218 /DNA_ORIENTATION=-
MQPTTEETFPSLRIRQKPAPATDTPRNGARLGRPPDVVVATPTTPAFTASSQLVPNGTTP